MGAAAWSGGGPGFEGWLLREALDHYLRLPAVLRFRLEALATAKAELAGRPHLMAVWDQWTGAAAPPDAGAGGDGYLDEGGGHGSGRPASRPEWPALMLL